MTAVPARAALLAAAVGVAAWLGSAYGPARDEARGREIAVRARVAPAELEQAIRLLDAGRARRPDGALVPFEAGQLLRAGRPEAAAALVRPLLRAEPANVTGWAVLALALQRTDPAGSRAAAARARALAPPVRSGQGVR